jgi:hypothetical protein
MRRRDLLASGSARAGTLLARSMRAQTHALVRVAVAFGVKAGMLSVLSAAASRARTIADWLRSEGFEIRLIADDARPEKPSVFFDAISALIDRSTLDQLGVCT